MSNYTITTNFGAKDDLPSGNAAKVIKGSEFTTEFTNIKTAVNSKADSVSPTFTGNTALNGTTTFGPDGTSTFNGTVNFTKDVTFDTDTMFVDVSENRVGIGTTNPLSDLHIYKQTDAKIIIEGDTDNDGGEESALLQFKTDGGIVGHTMGIEQGTDNALVIDAGNGSNTTVSNDLVFKTKPIGTTTTEERMRIDSVGRLLIGGTQVQTPSSIDNGVFIQSQTNEDVVGVNLYVNETSNNRRADFFLDDANGIYGMHSSASTGLPDFVVKSGTDERFRVTNAGKVGIGTTNPAQKLDVNGNIRVQGTYPKIEFVDTDSNPDFTLIGGNGSLQFYDETNAASRLLVNSSGNVGIGTSSPSEALTVSGNIQIEDNDGYLQFKDSNAGANNKLRRIYNAEQNLYISRRNDDGTLESNDVIIDSSGNLLVGKTSSGSTIEGAELNNSGSIFAVRNSNPAGAFDRKTTDGDVVQFRRDGATVGSISVTGSATAYNTSSDERLKENITDSADAGSKVDAIQIRQFDWKADGLHQDYGVIAQELINVAPEAVSEGDTEEDMMGVDYSKLVPMLIKEVQTLRNRVAQLENN